jgi:hypothetical protein
MENEQNDAPAALPSKKELKKQLADKMETALPELRDMLGEKKFSHRVKKAAKLLLEGLHKEDVTKKKKQPAAKSAAANKKATAKGVAEKSKQAAATKASAKKTAAKKTAANTSKTATAQQLKSAKKASNGKP